MSGIINISSDEDSDATVPFDFASQHFHCQIPIKTENPSLPKATATKSTQTFHPKQLFKMEEEFAQNCKRLKCAAERLRSLLKMETCPEMLDLELKHIWKLDKSWALELRVFQAQRISKPGNGKSGPTPDELLASIKRKRWCLTCAKTARIREDRGPLSKFFCSIECQLEHYNS